MDASDCKSLSINIGSNNYPDVCKFDGIKPIVCCPSTVGELSDFHLSDTSMQPATNKRQSGRIAVESMKGFTIPRYFDVSIPIQMNYLQNAVSITNWISLKRTNHFLYSL